MFFGGYERWMLRFWMLRKLDATFLDASILTRCVGPENGWKIIFKDGIAKDIKGVYLVCFWCGQQW